MPELPDITAYLTALTPRIVGQPLEHLRIASPLLLRTAIPRITEIEGKQVRSLRRIGKRIVFVFDDELFLVLHLMIAGRLHWRAFDPKKGSAKLGGRNNLAAFDFPTGSLVLTEAGTKRRASLHLVRGEQALEALDPGGIDVLSATPEAFRTALTQPLSGQANRTLKRALTDPRILSGIGNAYSDEILHAARLSPITQTGKLTPEEWQRLYTATRSTLETWIARFNAEAEKSFPEKVTAFRPEMAVHGRFGQPCPVCGAPIQRIRYADNETNYCAVCQTNGKVLADRSLSRLLGKDWPRTLDELEALKRK
jgi:formamidopyrimidine-DNA glycosylase